MPNCPHGLPAGCSECEATQLTDFFDRLRAANGDATRLADLMAEAIEMCRRAPKLTGRGDATRLSPEMMTAELAMVWTKDAYVRARRTFGGGCG
jgi:hypothetical protein